MKITAAYVTDSLSFSLDPPPALLHSFSSLLKTNYLLMMSVQMQMMLMI